MGNSVYSQSINMDLRLTKTSSALPLLTESPLSCCCICPTDGRSLSGINQSWSSSSSISWKQRSKNSCSSNSSSTCEDSNRLHLQDWFKTHLSIFRKCHTELYSTRIYIVVYATKMFCVWLKPKASQTIKALAEKKRKNVGAVCESVH